MNIIYTILEYDDLLKLEIIKPIKILIFDIVFFIYNL